MSTSRQKWAVVLAAGDGTRLASLTTDRSGNPVPKQYCSLDGGPSLLHEAISRAARIVGRDHICVIVAEQHRRYWEPALWSIAPTNIIVQPENRGTAHGVLLATLAVLTCDPLATVLFLPADHHVRHEAVLARSVREAVTLTANNASELMLVGLAPGDADPELGYIVPGEARASGARRVLRFIEKPGAEAARTLLACGALWNSFIFAASGAALLTTLRQQMPDTVEDMATALARDGGARQRHGALASFYENLESVDFSRRVLQHPDTALSVISSGECGWSDLGTPERLAATLRQLRGLSPRRPTSRPGVAPAFGPAVINLALQPLVGQIA